MKTLSHVTTRRDRCHLFGRRAAKLSPTQAVQAWYALAAKLEAMGDMDVPKFNDLLIAYCNATRIVRMPPHAKAKYRSNK